MMSFPGLPTPTPEEKVGKQQEQSNYRQDEHDEAGNFVVQKVVDSRQKEWLPTLRNAI